MSSGFSDDYVMVDHGALSESVHSHLPAISRYVDELNDGMRTISLEIHDHPELGYHEQHAHKVLVEFLASRKGWRVTPSAYSIDTAFVAVFDSGRKGPVVSFNAEYGAPAYCSSITEGRSDKPQMH